MQQPLAFISKHCFNMKYSELYQHETPLSYTILLKEVLGIKKCRQKHGGSYAISMTTGPKS